MWTHFCDVPGRRSPIGFFDEHGETHILGWVAFALCREPTVAAFCECRPESSSFYGPGASSAPLRIDRTCVMRASCQWSFGSPD